MPLSVSCPLCNATAQRFRQSRDRTYFSCDVCTAIFMDPRDYPLPADEKARYLTHNNDVHDKGYQQFVLPMVEAVRQDHPPGTHGLDYGAGTGPVAAKLLCDAGYVVTMYDPFFEPNAAAFQEKYDFIMAGEVIEHFHHPAKEFRLLKSLLKPGGRLYCLTLRYTEEINFEEWHYKNDPTHVIFYREETARWIKKAFGFTSLTLKERLIILQK